MNFEDFSKEKEDYKVSMNVRAEERSSMPDSTTVRLRRANKQLKMKIHVFIF